MAHKREGFRVRRMFLNKENAFVGLLSNLSLGKPHTCQIKLNSVSYGRMTDDQNFSEDSVNFTDAVDR